jgi:putative oxidoreductase
MMKNKILTLLSVLLSLMFLNAGLNKFFNYIPVPDGLPEDLMRDNAALVEISWLLPLVASMEILGGLLLLIPKTRALGLLVIFPILVGVLCTHFTVAPDGLLMALVIWAVVLWLMYENREKYLGLLR